MMISPYESYKILSNLGVKNLYHANSVLTSCQFLRDGALLSRGTVSRRGDKQTSQRSDEIDKKENVWFDVFTDSVDIHKRGSMVNDYGPVLFVLDLKIIKETYTGGLWFTKLNPTKWEEKQTPEKWFQSAEELKAGFDETEFGQMVVFRHCGGELPMGKYLRKIILDDNKSEGVKIDYFSMAYGALKYAMSIGNLGVEIEKRKCEDDCGCRTERLFGPDEETEKMFCPYLKKTKE